MMDARREIRAANRRIQALVDEMAAEALERLGYTREQQAADRRRAEAERLRAAMASLLETGREVTQAFRDLADAAQAAVGDAFVPFAEAFSAPTSIQYPTSEEKTRVRRDRT